jgi:hypothetical protein
MYEQEMVIVFDVFIGILFLIGTHFDCINMLLYISNNIQIRRITL